MGGAACTLLSPLDPATSGAPVGPRAAGRGGTTAHPARALTPASPKTHRQTHPPTSPDLRDLIGGFRRNSLLSSSVEVVAFSGGRAGWLVCHAAEGVAMRPLMPRRACRQTHGLGAVTPRLAAAQQVLDAHKPFSIPSTPPARSADEEGVRFQSTYLGSRALAGTLVDSGEHTEQLSNLRLQ